MNDQNFIKRLGITADVKQFVFWMLGASIVLNLLLAVAVIQMPKGVKHELVPPQVDKTFWVGLGSFDPSHLEQMGGYVAQLMLNATPKNARYLSEQLLKIVDPQTYSDLNAQIQMNAALLARMNVSTTFHPTHFSFNTKLPSSIAVHGDLKTHYSDKTIKSEKKTYVVEFGRSASGQMTLVRFTETTPRDPLSIEADAKAAIEE